MDLERLRPVTWLCADAALSGILRRLLRRPALGAQGRLAGHRDDAAPALLPQLVPERLPLRNHEVPLGLRQIVIESLGVFRKIDRKRM